MATQRRILPWSTPAALAMVMIFAKGAHGQGIEPDTGGHGLLNGQSVLAFWNFTAGSDIPEDYGRYPEFLPFLGGWDYRINLPHVQFQLARTASGASGPALVGVTEAVGTLADFTFEQHGHVNNSIWLFQMDSAEGRIFAKVLPSRRDLNGRATTSVSSLTGRWFPVGSGVGDGAPVETPAVAVVGKGIGVARVYVVARDRAGALHMTSHVVNGQESLGVEPPVLTASLIGVPGLENRWPEAWVPVGVASPVRPAISEAFNGKVAVAYHADGALRVQVYTPTTNTWSPAFAITGAAVAPPRLIWDGTALNVLFIAEDRPILQHAYALADDPLQFYARRPVSSLVAVRGDHFHGIFFHRRLHVVIHQDNGSDSGPVFYTTATSDPGRPSTWSIPSETGLATVAAPRVAWMNENIVVVATSPDGRVRYARKDPNRPGNEITGAAFADHWLEPGLDVDPTAPGSFSDLDTLTYNGDVYLAARKSAAANLPAGTYLVNFGRAAMKQLITDKWGIQFRWGEPGGNQPLGRGEFASETDIPAVGDLDGNGQVDLIRFTQKFSPEGQAPVFVRRNVNGQFIGQQLWAEVFSLPGEIPMVGNFDGDNTDDIISFAQKPQVDFDGRLIGGAPVWVRLSSGAQGGTALWHDNFSPQAEIPFVGDFNGDGKDDIVSFAQKPLSNFDGGLVALSPVHVSLSDGARFGPSRIWHDSFSFPGEIPMVGDFNGDGLDDIITFVQKAQTNPDGSPLGTAPVWVALSDGTRFGPASVWHTFFSLAGEIPQVADLNMDGLDDIVTFLADRPGAGDAARNIYVAFSAGGRFARSTLWHSDFVRRSQVRLGPGKRVYSPVFGSIGGTGPRSLGTWTGVAEDFERPLLDIIAFSPDGSVQTARTMGNVPYPAGAPWERYKWFTEKGLGVALFPEWIYAHAGHCIAADHRFDLLGLGGVGGSEFTRSSVRFGGRAPHILEELGHSLFANCFRPNSSDPFNLAQSIFAIPPEQGGMGANQRPGCENNTSGFHSCRPDAPEEHYFLQLLSRYRLDPEFFRDRIAGETDPAAQARLAAQYQWLKQNWFQGQEFATGVPANASLAQRGVPLLPAALPAIVAEDVNAAGDPDASGSPNPACGSGAACGAGAPLALLLTFARLRIRRRLGGC